MAATTTAATCAHCGADLGPGRRADARYCKASHRVAARRARREEALRIFLRGSELRATGEWDPETVAALDREAARILALD